MAQKKYKGALKKARSRANDHVLEQLYAFLESHRGADPQSSEAARLFKRGREQIAKKIGEEAVEALIEGIRGDRFRLALESADLLYHLIALWAENGVRPETVWSELAQRVGLSERT